MNSIEQPSDLLSSFSAEDSESVAGETEPSPSALSPSAEAASLSKSPE